MIGDIVGDAKAPHGVMATIVIRNRKTGESLRYPSDDWLPAIPGWNKPDPAGRFDAAKAAEHLFHSEPPP